MSLSTECSAALLSFFSGRCKAHFEMLRPTPSYFLTSPLRQFFRAALTIERKVFLTKEFTRTHKFALGIPNEMNLENLNSIITAADKVPKVRRVKKKKTQEGDESRNSIGPDLT